MTGTLPQDPFNLAYTLAQLELAFYEEALRTVPGLDRDARALLTTCREHEAAHVGAVVALLRRFGVPPGPPRGFSFGDSLADPRRCLQAAQRIEDLTVSAYNGIVGQTERAEARAALCRVVQVDARHAATLRLANGQPITQGAAAFDPPLDTGAAWNALAGFIST